MHSVKSEGWGKCFLPVKNEGGANVWLSVETFHKINLQFQHVLIETKVYSLNLSQCRKLFYIGNYIFNKIFYIPSKKLEYKIIIMNRNFWLKLK